MLLPPFSDADQNSFAAFTHFFNQYLKPNESHLFTVDASGQWSYDAHRETPDTDWVINIVFSAPTISLVQRVMREVSAIVTTPEFFLHPCSDFTHGRIGLVVPVAKALKDNEIESLHALAPTFDAEVSVLNRAPRLSLPGLLVMDMDSTVIACECIDEIAKLAGVGEQVADVTERAMQGELDFEESLRSRVKCLASLPEQALETVRQQLPLMPGLVNLVQKLQHYGWRIAIASGGFTYFADHLRDRLGLDAAVANQLEIVEHQLTGDVLGDVVDTRVKADTVEQLSSQWQIPMSQTIAMGDGANDLQMMSTAQLGIAYHAKPIVQQQADCSIRVSGLDTALLYLRY